MAGEELARVTTADVDMLLSDQVPLLAEGGAMVAAEAYAEVDRLLDLRNELALRALGSAEIDLL